MPRLPFLCSSTYFHEDLDSFKVVSVGWELFILSKTSNFIGGPNPLNMIIKETKFICMLSHFSYVQPFATLWTTVPQAPLSMGLSRQEYWSGVPCPPPGGLHDSGNECLLHWQAGSLPLAPPRKLLNYHNCRKTSRIELQYV